MLNSLSSDFGIECAFAIEARSTVDDPSFRLVATLSENEFRYKYGPRAEPGKKTFNVSYEEEVELRKKCLERALGNVEVITQFKPRNVNELPKGIRVLKSMKSKKKPV